MVSSIVSFCRSQLYRLENKNAGVGGSCRQANPQLLSMNTLQSKLLILLVNGILFLTSLAVLIKTWNHPEQMRFAASLIGCIIFLVLMAVYVYAAFLKKKDK
jgi:hypothetical protein